MVFFWQGYQWLDGAIAGLGRLVAASCMWKFSFICVSHANACDHAKSQKSGTVYQYHTKLGVPRPYYNMPG
jgi:hypothetical protein